MHTINPTLQSALDAGSGKPIINAVVGYLDGSPAHTDTPRSYKLTGTTLEFETPYVDFAGDTEAIWLTRGLRIAGIDYTYSTSRFYILSRIFTAHRTQIIKGGLFPAKYYLNATPTNYAATIAALCTHFSKSAIFKNPAEAWLNYQFFPDFQPLSLNDPNLLAPLLQQKRLIKYCDHWNEDIRFYSADVMGATEATIIVKDHFEIEQTLLRNRQYVWIDENEQQQQAGDVTDAVHNLGYLKTGESPPARLVPSLIVRASIRPDLRLQDGDVLTINTPAGLAATSFAKITEQWTPEQGPEPRWRTIIETNPIFEVNDGGKPSDFVLSQNYTALNTSGFTQTLADKKTNLQTALDKIDKHQHYFPFGVYTAISPFVKGATYIPFTGSINKKLTFVKWTQSFYIQTTNDANNYWVFRLKYANGSVAANLTTQGLAPNTNLSVATTTFAPTTLNASHVLLYVDIYAVLNPGNIYFYGSAVQITE